MQASEKGKLIVLSAPSGAGKTSLSKALLEKVPNTAVSISHTTRAPRPGEQHGVDYFFISPEEFAQMVHENAFLEYANVFDKCYGTSHAAVEHLLAQGKHVIFDIDWQGAHHVKAKMPGAKTIFIFPPSLAELRRRLQQRGQDDRSTIEYRMQQAMGEMAHYGEFDYLLVNDDFNRTLQRLIAIILDKEGAAGQTLADIDPALIKALENIDKKS